MSSPTKPVPKPLPEKEVMLLAAATSSWPDSDSLSIVNGFSELGTASLKRFPSYMPVSEISSDRAALIAITAQSYQYEYPQHLVRLGYKEILQFSGSGGADLRLWIKDRTGDSGALIAPPLPELKVEHMCSVHWPYSEQHGFPSCCGAYVNKLIPNQITESYSRGPALTGAYDTLRLELCVVKCDNAYLGDMIYGGYVPIYKYTTQDGVGMYLIAKPPSGYDGARLLTADQESLSSMARSFRKKSLATASLRIKA